MSTTTGPRRRIVIAVLVGALVLAACSDDADDPDVGVPSSTQPITTQLATSTPAAPTTTEPGLSPDLLASLRPFHDAETPCPTALAALNNPATPDELKQLIGFGFSALASPDGVIELSGTSDRDSFGTGPHAYVLVDTRGRFVPIDANDSFEHYQRVRPEPGEEHHEAEVTLGPDGRYTCEVFTHAGGE